MDSLPTTSKNPQNSFFTVSQAADFLNISAKTLRRWEAKGILVPLRTTGGQRRYHRQALQNFKSKKELTRMFIREYPVDSAKSRIPTPTSAHKFIFNQKLLYSLTILLLLALLPALAFFTPLGSILGQGTSQLANFISNLWQKPQTALQEPDSAWQLEKEPLIGADELELVEEEPLKLQPLGLSGIEMLGGKIQIDIEGNILIQGDLETEGVIKAKGFCIDNVCFTKEQLQKILENLE